MFLAHWAATDPRATVLGGSDPTPVGQKAIDDTPESDYRLLGFAKMQFLGRWGGRGRTAWGGAQIPLRVRDSNGEDLELHVDQAAGFLTAAVSRVYIRLVRTHACR
jgi:hypothetical protein